MDHTVKVWLEAPAADSVVVTPFLVIWMRPSPDRTAEVAVTEVPDEST
jgi:hypothetical protein